MIATGRKHVNIGNSLDWLPDASYYRHHLPRSRRNRRISIETARQKILDVQQNGKRRAIANY
jgi:hypothetical protein